MVTPHIATIPLIQMASGDSIALQVYRYSGNTPGKKAYLQANLHGAEIAGNVVIQRLMDWLSTLDERAISGEIHLVPVCNPLGVNARMHHFPTGRYSPYEGDDWNRIFWDYEKTGASITSMTGDAETVVKAYRAQILEAFKLEQVKLDQSQGISLEQRYRTVLQSLALDADYVIDLHSSSNRGMAYLYYFPGREEGARLFSLDFGILLDEYDGDAFDESFIKPWLALERACGAAGHPLRCDVEAYTLEIGTGMKVDPLATEKSLRGVQNYLIQKGLVNQALVKHQGLPSDSNMTLYSRHQVHKYYTTAGGILQNRVAPAATVAAGDVLYELVQFNKSGHMPTVQTVRSQHSGLIYDVSSSEVANQGEYVLSLVEA
ncbi:MAG: succinylglutamate desuccinylase/aspartoacylase family protein [Cyanobacteria bacterium J06632_22]